MPPAPVTFFLAGADGREDVLVPDLQIGGDVGEPGFLVLGNDGKIRRGSDDGGAVKGAVLLMYGVRHIEVILHLATFRHEAACDAEMVRHACLAGDVVRLGDLFGRLQEHLVPGTVLGSFIECAEEAILPLVLQ